MDERQPLLSNAPQQQQPSSPTSVRARVYAALEHKTPFGVRLNIALFLVILVNITAFIISTDASINERYGEVFATIEAVTVVIFTIEYVLRLWSIVEDPDYSQGNGRLRYFVSFFSLVDLIAILPFYIDLAMPETDLVGSQFVRIVRLFRLLKVDNFVFKTMCISLYFAPVKKSLLYIYIW